MPMGSSTTPGDAARHRLLQAIWHRLIRRMRAECPSSLVRQRAPRPAPDFANIGETARGDCFGNVAADDLGRETALASLLML
jgi:hypothetical protein